MPKPVLRDVAARQNGGRRYLRMQDVHSVNGSHVGPELPAVMSIPCGRGGGSMQHPDPSERARAHHTALSIGHHPLGSCIPRSGLSRSDFVPWRFSDACRRRAWIGRHADVRKPAHNPTHALQHARIDCSHPSQHRTNRSMTHHRTLDAYRNKDLSRNRYALPLAVPEQLTLRLSHDP